MSSKLNVEMLNKLFLDSLGEVVESHSSTNIKPLIVKLKPPYNNCIKVYMYNCTNPIGARQTGEFKSQLILPNQRRGQRGKFELELNIKTLLVGFASVTGDIADGVFILWELKKHMEFAYSTNVQISLKAILQTEMEPMFTFKKRGNDETVILSKQKKLIEAIQKRIEVDIDLLLEE
ncbi:hypothetical protein [Candidatus Enterococcus murrayae]|uniref:Methylase-associated X1 domain-containing protein n=1 Tax=Candidatus Enterococcus murrayae TaxID=2815321 RepID=A0ABS3HNR6_9ENTE|nr:hypothetical protein [Enterococcus sp. MJM16]MBO0455083.1 hypothetical protein [Enterococcus sp. MJM16]